MKTLKIGIASYDRMKARTIAIARGELKPARDEPMVWFTSIESFAKVLSSRNRELLATIESFLRAGVDWSVITEATGIDQEAFRALRRGLEESDSDDRQSNASASSDN